MAARGDGDDAEVEEVVGMCTIGEGGLGGARWEGGQ